MTLLHSHPFHYNFCLPVQNCRCRKSDREKQVLRYGSSCPSCKTKEGRDMRRWPRSKNDSAFKTNFRHRHNTQPQAVSLSYSLTKAIHQYMYVLKWLMHYCTFSPLETGRFAVCNHWGSRNSISRASLRRQTRTERGKTSSQPQPKYRHSINMDNVAPAFHPHKNSHALSKTQPTQLGSLIRYQGNRGGRSIDTHILMPTNILNKNNFYA